MRVRTLRDNTAGTLFLVTAGILLALIVFASGARAADEINVDNRGVTMHGYDPVAYFRSGEPVKGSPEHAATFEGATYHFASADNRSAFEAHPEKYAPAFGGFCSYGVRVGKKFDVDPNAWAIVDGQLYMMLDQGTQAVWSERRDTNIDIATRIWPNIRPVAIEQLNN